MTDSTHSQILSAQAGDGSIGQTLVEVDGKLTRWLEAMSVAQRALCEQLTGVAAPQPPEQTHEDRPAVETDEPVQPSAPAGLFVRTDEFAAASGAASDSAGESSDPAPDVRSARRSGVNETSEEEALLSTLDEQTARAVRVKRRLNSGKSLQELIEQVQAANAKADDTARESKRWWRRDQS